MAREPELERSVMEVMWDVDDRLTPAEVLERLDRDLAYTTIMTVLSRLWKKGLVTREKRGKAYAYGAALDRKTVVAANMLDLVDRAGDTGPVLSRFADNLSETEREYLIQLLGGR